MIGFDAIGSVSISELGGEADTVVNIPGAAATVTTTAPVVTAGASVRLSAAAVTVIASAPAVEAGVSLYPPTANVSVASTTCAVAISATVTVPTCAVTVTTSVPLVAGGAEIIVPAAAVAVALGAAPVVTAGKAVFPPTAIVSVQPIAPGISISATIHPPTVALTVTAPKPDILGGNYIDASNTITTTTLYGEIGSSSVGELAIGEGEPSTNVIRLPPLVAISTSPPFVTAGKSILPSAAVVSISSARAEIDSRSRKLRILAIAS